MKKIDLTEKFYRGCTAGRMRMDTGLLSCFNTAPKYLKRALCSSGVRICFTTDAREMEFSLVFGAAVRPVFTSDCFVNGEKITLHGEGPHKLEFSEGAKQIIIHLPHLVLIEKIALSVNDTASVTPLTEKKKNILFCGDSIMQGMVTSSPSLALAPRVAAGLDMDFINTSVGGARMDPEHLRLTAQLPGDIMFVALGVNDAILKTPPEEFEENTVKALENFKSFSGRKYIILPIPNMAPSTPDLEKYRGIIRRCAGKHPEIRIIDGYEFFPAEEANYHDGTHPNDKGAEIYARYLIKITGGEK